MRISKVERSTYASIEDVDWDLEEVEKITFSYDEEKYNERIFGIFHVEVSIIR